MKTRTELLPRSTFLIWICDSPGNRVFRTARIATLNTNRS